MADRDESGSRDHSAIKLARSGGTLATAPHSAPPPPHFMRFPEEIGNPSNPVAPIDPSNPAEMQGFCVFGPQKLPPATAPDRRKNGQFGALIRAWRAPICAPIGLGIVRVQWWSRVQVSTEHHRRSDPPYFSSSSGPMALRWSIVSASSAQIVGISFVEAKSTSDFRTSMK